MLEFFYAYNFVILLSFVFLLTLLLIFIMTRYIVMSEFAKEVVTPIIAMSVSMIIGFVGLNLIENYLDKTYKPYYVSQLIYKRSDVECTGKHGSNCGGNYVFTIKLPDGRIIDQDVSYYTYRQFNEGSTVVFHPSLHEVSRRDLFNVIKYVDNKDQPK